MSIICYRTDGGVQNGTGLPGAAVKRSSLQSTWSMKRKKEKMSHSSGSTSTHSRESIRSSESDKGTITMPQEKQSSPAVIGVQNFQKTEKEDVLPQIKANNSHIDYKRREFLNFRKQFIQQQNTYLELYAQLRDLEERSGAHGGTVGDVRLLSVTGWPVHDLLLLMPEDVATRKMSEVKGVLGPKILQQLRSQLTRIPEEVQAMGIELMSRRMEILEFMRKNENVLVHDSNHKEWQTMKAEFDEETEKLRRLVSATAKSFESKIAHSLDVAKIPWIDRDNMIKKIESLQKELHIYKKDKGDDSGKTDKNYDQNHKLQKVLEELCRERSARVTLKEMLAAAEGRMASARVHTSELERQLSVTRAELTAAQRRLDNLKQLHQYRATTYDAHSKRLRQLAGVSKNGEVTIEVLSRQRDALELRIRELQQEAAILMREAESRENQLSSHVECLRKKLEEQIQKRETTEARVQELEQSLRHVQEQYTVLQERSRELVTLQHQKCLDYLPRKGQCSVEEIEIWNDLQATKGALDRVKQELEHSRADKDSLMQSLAKIAREGSENEMAQELLSRERIIRRMQKNIEELKDDKKKMEKNLTSYENQLTTLRFEISLLRSLNSYKSDNEKIPNEELEREVFNLYLQVITLKRERAALASENVSHALLLERHERCAELFAQVTRARRQLAAQIEGTAVPAMDETASHEVLSSFSKTYKSSADTWSALRAERNRVLRLEDTVCTQRQQLDRESLLRVQHEQRRTYLERELIRTWAGNLTQNTGDKEVADVLYSSNKLT